MRKSMSLTAEEIARVCHEANRALQFIQNDPTIPVSPPWGALRPSIRASAVDGVRFHLDHPDATPADSHANWCAFKLADGWTVGPVKNEARKEHPLLIPYSELPAAQQVKDRLFMSIVEALR